MNSASSDIVRRAVVTATGVVLFALISAARYSVHEPEAGILFLLVVPIAIFAMEYGTAGGLVSAAAGVAVFAAWNASEAVGASAFAHVTRATAFAVTALLIGHFAGGALRSYDRRRRGLVRELRRALGRDELFLEYQPIVAVEGGDVASVEALVRWRHPRRGVLPPGEFVPAAEESALVWPFTVRTLELAMEQIAAWREADLELRVDVNVSAAALLDERLPREVLRLRRELELPADALAVELTERVIMLDFERAAAALQDLREIGVQTLIDDFGTGHSSLARLQTLPVHGVKIDREFVRALARGGTESVIAAIVALAEQFRLVTVAEGVEDEATCGRLSALGCDFVQGFYFSPPRPPEEALAFLTTTGGRTPARADE